MNARNRFVQRVLDGLQAHAQAVRNPSIQSLRDRGRCCASCEAVLPMPYSPGFRQCSACRPGDVHAIYMVFAYRDGVWHCRFLDEAPDGTLVKEVTFVNPDKVRETARRGKALTFAAARLRMDYALTEHREARLWLQLSAQQYLDLRHATDRGNHDRMI